MQQAARLGIAAATTILIAMMSAGVAAGLQQVPLTFEEVVAGADSIFLGRAVDRRATWDDTGQGRVIVTRVVFAVERVYKGPAMTQTVLEFLGGTIGNTTFEVEGMPTFSQGDRDVLFVSSDVRSLNPLVGPEAARFRVVRDAPSGRDSVTIFDGAASALGGQLGPSAAGSAKVIPLQEFEVKIAQALRGRGR